MFGLKSLVFLLGKSVRGLFASKEKPRVNQRAPAFKGKETCRPENSCSAKECARFVFQQTLRWLNPALMGYWFSFGFRASLEKNYVDCKRF